MVRRGTPLQALRSNLDSGRVRSWPALLVIAVAATLACGGNGDQAIHNVACTAPSPCPNDPPPPAENVLGCQMGTDDPSCGAKYQTFRNCTAMYVKCAANGTEDGPATLAASTACATERQDWNLCVRAELDAATD
jgi:hypothetical protein